MNLCYTAIFNQHDTLKNPTVISEGWRYVCYTDDPLLTSDVYEIRRPTIEYRTDPRYAARFYKIIASIGAARSIWVDASFQINVDLNKWWSEHFRSPMTCIKHPIRDCVYQEADAVVNNSRGGSDNVRQYMNSVTIPEHNGLIQSGIIMREHTVAVRKFCETWWIETTKCLRDQITFANVVNGSTLPIHYINYDYRRGKEFEFLGHLKKSHAV